MNDLELSIIPWNGAYKYMGVEVGAASPIKWKGASLRDALLKVAGVALKPQQKMFLIRIFLLPNYYYQLVHQRITVTVLKKMNNLVRGAVRLLYLPPDTLTPMFHAHPGEGLAVPELEKMVPALLKGFKSRIQSREGFWSEVAESIKIPS